MARDLKIFYSATKFTNTKSVLHCLPISRMQRLDDENSNFVFQRIYLILASLECGQITFYDDLFHKLFLIKYRLDLTSTYVLVKGEEGLDLKMLKGGDD